MPQPIRRVDPPKTFFIQSPFGHYYKFGSLSQPIEHLTKLPITARFLPEKTEISAYLEGYRQQVNERASDIADLEKKQLDLAKYIEDEKASNTNIFSLFSRLFTTNVDEFSEIMSLSEGIVSLIVKKEPRRLQEMLAQAEVYRKQRDRIDRNILSANRKHVSSALKLEQILGIVASTRAYAITAKILGQKNGLPYELLEAIRGERPHPVLHKHLMNPPPSPIVARFIQELAPKTRNTKLRADFPDPYLANALVVSINRIPKIANSLTFSTALLGITGLKGLRAGLEDRLLPEKSNQVAPSFEAFHQVDHVSSLVDYSPFREKNDELYVHPNDLIASLEFQEDKGVRFLESEQAQVLLQIARKSEISDAEYNLLIDMSVAWEDLATSALNEQGRRSNDKNWKR